MDTTFAELPLGSKLQAAITAAGYTVPTPIQAQAIPVAVTGRDILGIAQTGTGKTASFVLPMIQRLESGRARARMPRSLILAPTRELAAQVEQSFDKYGINHKLDVALLIGGVSMDDQVKKLDRGVDVLIATPGRLLDHFQRGRIMLMGVEILVIDEADRMLDMGFIPDIEKICKLLPPRRQTLFFSATMPNEIQRLVDQFLKDPVRIEVARPATTAKTIKQHFRFCTSTEDWEKREILRDLIKSHPVKNAIIFCNRKRDVAILHKSLVKHGFNAGALHGDLEQRERMATLDKFRSGEILLLAASDVAARGLDIPDVSHIFNFDIPWAGDDYVHRIGRTGRAGKEGVSVSLVTSEDLKLLKDIEKATGEQPIWIGEAPTDADFADSGKRRRGRRGEKPGAKPGEARGASRGGKPGEARSGGRGGRGERSEGYNADRRPRSNARRDPEQVEPIATGTTVEAGHDGPPREPRHETRGEPRRQPRNEPRRAAQAEAIPGFGDQPTIERAERERDDRGQPDRASGERRGRRDGRPPRNSERSTPEQRASQQGAPDQSREQSREQAPERQQARPQERAAQPPREQTRDRPERSERAPERASERAPERPAREARARKPEPASGGNVGFADNVPAFLRRPVRPTKAAANE